jgi:hypothetical protein
MKKTLLVTALVAAALGAPLSLAARLPEFIDPPENRDQQLLVDLSQSGYGSLGLLYDYALSSEHSLEFGLSAAGNGPSNNYWSAYGAKFAFNFWLQQDFWEHPNEPLLGWYLGPEVVATAVDWHYDYAGNSYNTGAGYLGGGGQLGYQWIFHPGLTARAFVEADYQGGNLDGVNGAPGPGYGGFNVGGHAAVGWSF